MKKATWAILPFLVLGTVRFACACGLGLVTSPSTLDWLRDEIAQNHLEVELDSVEELPGGFANRVVFFKDLAGHAKVLRGPRGTTSDRYQDNLNNIILAAKAEVGPRAQVLPSGSILMEFLPGSVTGSQMLEPARQVELGELLRKWHRSGAVLPFTLEPIANVHYYLGLAKQRHYRATGPVKKALSRLAEIEVFLRRYPERVPLHFDLHVGNLRLDLEGRLRLIDFDTSQMGDPFLDAACASTYLSYGQQETERMLRAMLGRDLDQADRAHLRAQQILFNLQQSLWALNESLSAPDRTAQFEGLHQFYNHVLDRALK